MNKGEIMIKKLYLLLLIAALLPSVFLITQDHKGIFLNSGASSLSFSNLFQGLYFSSVSCQNDSFCLLAGNQAGIAGALYDSGNGGYSFNPISVQFNGPVSLVTCYQPQSCLLSVVNEQSYTSSLYITGNLKTFSSVTLPVNVGSFTGISCMQGPECLAVGSDNISNPFLLYGSASTGSFSEVNLPTNISLINGLSCLQNFCLIFAQNSTGYPVILSYLNSTLTELTNSPATLAVINSVSCVLGYCLIVGSNPSSQPVGFFYSNGNFEPLSFPSNASVLTVASCNESGQCFAGGQNQMGQPVLYQGSIASTGFNQIYSAANPGGVNAISCYQGCVVLANQPGQPSYVFSNASGSFVSSLVNYQPQSSEIGSITSVSCVGGSSFCAFIVSDGASTNLIATSNNDGLSVNLSSGIAVSQLSSISCASTTTCVAVGLDLNSNPVALITTNSGTNWTNASLPSGFGIPNSVSCYLSICAVSSVASYGINSQIAISNNFSTFSSVTLPASNVLLNQTACFESANCIAVGGISAALIVGNLPAPSITSITPNSGPTTGMTSVVVTGQYFVGGLSVYFGTVQALQVQYVSAEELYVFSPPVSTAGSVDITVSDLFGTSATSGSDIFSYVLPSTLPTAGHYFPLTPLRILDTRSYSTNVYQYSSQPLGPNQTINVQIVNYVNKDNVSDNVPTTATAVVLNLTALDSTANNDYLSVWPAGQTRPVVSSLNFNSNQIVSNLVTVPIGSNGQISVFNAVGDVNVIGDLEGYFAPSSSSAGLFNPLAPIRVADTRTYSGNTYQDANSLVGPNSVINVSFANVANIAPADIQAVVLNVTVVSPTATQGYLTIWPSGLPMPTASNLNFSANETVADRVIVGLGSNYSISIYNALGTTNVIVDLDGFFTTSADSNGYLYFPVPPTRVCDTRLYSTNPTLCNGQRLAQGAILNVEVANNVNNDSVPSMGSQGNPIAVIANITATNPTALGGYFSIFPTGLSVPSSSDLNFSPGISVPNLTVVGLGPEGDISVYNALGSADLLVDIEGYFAL